ncbi:MAG: MBOAT family protein [Anaerolineaceae bacterium]|nr:MAG: MBOAT family protein [Anaerolineaceae bacterium]
MMDFTSLTFLFLFLPLLVGIYLLVQERFRPALLLVASLLFLAWGSSSALFAFAFLIGGNFIFGQWIEKSPVSKSRLTLGVIFNLALLIFYKVFTTYKPIWFVTAFERVLPDAVEKSILELVYPIGLSYIALQMISYLVDVARGTVSGEKNFLHFAFYVTLFPKIPTGPITAYRSIRENLSAPAPALSDVADGLRRFAIGLIKKTLIADGLAKIANPAFNLPSPNFSPQIAWLALLAFTLQIYYDFSGFTDMAIGLGRVFGFTFPENFNQPFTAKSVGEFWRRWHMSLSAWFREYVFYPLERRRIPLFGQQLNILIVFAFTGLWHGLTPTFLVWGLIHGLALALESTAFGRWLKSAWRPAQFVYTFSIVAFSWIFFRSPSLTFSLQFIQRLAGDTANITPLPFSVTRPLPFIDPTTWIALAVAILLQTPLASLLTSWWARLSGRFPRFGIFSRPLTDVFLLALFWSAIAVLVSGGFAPGIYDKF